MSTSYTDVFTGKNITAAFPQYSAIALTEDITLSWPAQFQNTNHVVSVIMDITPNSPGRTVTMPDATQGSVGFAFTINNPGLESFQLLDSTGGPIVTILSVKANLIWLIDTEFPAGLWRNIPAFGGAGAVTSVNATSDSNNLIVTGDPALPITTGGTIEFAVTRDLLALTQFGASTGFSARTAVETWALRSILGTANQISIVDGDGIAGSPTLSLSPNIVGISSITLSGLSFGVGASNVIRSTGLNIPIVLTPNGTGVIELSNNTEIKSGNRFKFFNAGNTNYITFRAGATGVNQDLAWPTSLAAPTQVMANDGFGSLYWASVTTYAGASTVDAVARYSNLTGGLKDSPNFIVTDAGAATGLVSCIVGDIRIATIDSQRITTTTLDQDLVIAPSGNGTLRNQCDVRIEPSGGFQRKLRLYDNQAFPNGKYAGIQASPLMVADVTWIWPAADSAGVFSSDGASNISITPFTSYFPNPSTPNAVPRFSNTVGYPLKNSLFVISDVGAATGLLSAVIGGLNIATNIITPTAANTDLILTPTGTGALKSIGELQILPAAGVSKSIKLFNDAGTFFSALKAAPALAGASTTWILPSADSAGIFTSNGANSMSITPLTSYFPVASTINAVPRFSNTTGSPLKDSLFIIDDTGNGTGLLSCVIGGLSLATNIITPTAANTNIALTPTGTGVLAVTGELQVLPAAGVSKSIKLFNNAGTFFSSLKATTGLGVSTTWTLPTADLNALMSSNGAGALTLATGLTAPGSGKIGLGTTVFEATSTNSITFLNGTAAVGAPAANSLALQSFAATSTVGTTLGWYGSGTGGIYAGIANASTHKINIKINGTDYYIMATTVA